MVHSSSVFSDSKKHFLILDALRGVASIMVVMFHIMEVFSGGDHTKQIINHGYLAVDFFFMLSGYVMAHAYDDRWGRMTVKDFFKRRLVRLHPMILMGMTIGAIWFYFGESSLFPKIADTPVWLLSLILLLGWFLIPIPVSMDPRGWDETYPLNGPGWSLFFEYIANVLHALVIRRMSKFILGICVFIAALALVHLAVMSPDGDVIGGWSLTSEQLQIGFTRLLFPYMAGMLLRRTIKVMEVKKMKTFLFCSFLLIAALSFPRIGGHANPWMNGIYESAVIILLFPAIVYLGAVGEVTHPTAQKVYTFLGDISYPLYIIHYPFVYIFMGWVTDHHIPVSKGIFVGAGVLFFAMGVAYAALKLYDEPVRKWLARKYIAVKK
ncbi:MAG: acyltransferase [Chitinophagaceae bacterium]|nr:acyltransferase [Chitinophagaceae bacterium]